MGPGDPFKDPLAKKSKPPPLPKKGPKGAPPPKLPPHPGHFEDHLSTMMIEAEKSGLLDGEEVRMFFSNFTNTLRIHHEYVANTFLVRRCSTATPLWINTAHRHSPTTDQPLT